MHAHIMSLHTISLVLHIIFFFVARSYFYLAHIYFRLAHTYYVLLLGEAHPAHPYHVTAYNYFDATLTYHGLHTVIFKWHA